MTDGGDGVFERSAVVSAILGETRNSVTLHPILIGYSATYLLALAFGGDAEEVKASLPVTSEEWMVSFDEAWKANTENVMPGLILGRAKTWSGFSVIGAGPPPPLIDAAALAGGGHSGGAGAGASTSMGTVTASYGDVHVAHMLKGLVVSDYDVDKAINDINSQRISGPRIMGL